MPRRSTPPFGPPWHACLRLAVEFDGRAIELKGPYRRLSMVGEVSKVVGEDLRQADDGMTRELIARRLGHELKSETKSGEGSRRRSASWSRAR